MKSANDGVKVSFSPTVRAALHDLEAAVHFSDHFDLDIRRVLEGWVKEKTLDVRDILVAFPALAEETFRHIHATGDVRASEAWNDLRNQIVEEGFKVLTTPARQR